jgi:hypothetical protein
MVPEFIHHDFVAGKVFSIQLIVFSTQYVVMEIKLALLIDFLQTVFDGRTGETVKIILQLGFTE